MMVTLNYTEVFDWELDFSADEMLQLQQPKDTAVRASLIGKIWAFWHNQFQF